MANDLNTQDSFLCLTASILFSVWHKKVYYILYESMSPFTGFSVTNSWHIHKERHRFQKIVHKYSSPPPPPLEFCIEVLVSDLEYDPDFLFGEGGGGGEVDLSYSILLQKYYIIFGSIFRMKSKILSNSYYLHLYFQTIMKMWMYLLCIRSNYIKPSLGNLQQNICGKQHSPLADRIVVQTFYVNTYFLQPAKGKAYFINLIQQWIQSIEKNWRTLKFRLHEPLHVVTFFCGNVTTFVVKFETLFDVTFETFLVIFKYFNKAR